MLSQIISSKETKNVYNLANEGLQVSIHGRRKLPTSASARPCFSLFPVVLAVGKDIAPTIGIYVRLISLRTHQVVSMYTGMIRVPVPVKSENPTG